MTSRTGPLIVACPRCEAPVDVDCRTRTESSVEPHAERWAAALRHQELALHRLELARPPQDLVRVLRIVEYTGPRGLVEAQVARSIHGSVYVGGGHGPHHRQAPLVALTQVVRIAATTITEYPEIDAAPAAAGKPLFRVEWLPRCPQDGGEHQRQQRSAGEMVIVDCAKCGALYPESD